MKETNYKFSFDPVINAVRTWVGPETVQPTTVLNSLLNTVSEDRQDLSISRPKSRIEWGISVPSDHDQTIYVWLDALSNYLTVMGYADCNQEQEEVIK